MLSAGDCPNYLLALFDIQDYLFGVTIGFSIKPFFLIILIQFPPDSYLNILWLDKHMFYYGDPYTKCCAIFIPIYCTQILDLISCTVIG